ncbi:MULTISPECIES: hypothetical protein [Paenibacillus]|uniref:Uncharacterized protein n=1 Tax=Paenibacillus xylanilyticus TaxID=248903 RepID=A0A7Y6ETY0_9BACL|nr:hypothetical protein [Paenibacillus xylanilyticus]NUU76447.1 hypothetical protein [Paenibacillus xylanilyticus]
MIAVLLFAGLYLMDWSSIRSSKKTIKRVYFVLLLFYLVWNTLAVSWSGWPDPNDMIQFVFGWADRITQ